MSDRGDRLTAAIARGPLVMDAAMGTRLVDRGLKLDDPENDSAFWNLSNAEDVSAIHTLDVAAGADVLVTNTFLACRTWLETKGRGNLVAAINRRAVAIAREAAGPDRFVLGSIGPSASFAPTGDAYREQVEILTDAGVDALLLETHTPGQALDATRVVGEWSRLPVLVSMVRAAPEIGPDFIRNLERQGVAAIGYNCVAGMNACLCLTERLAAWTSLPLLLRPSATPAVQGGANADESPGAFADLTPKLVELGTRLIGGCCGTTEAHVAAIRAGCYHGGSWPCRGRDPREPTSMEVE